MLNNIKSLPVWLAVLLAVAIGGYWYYWQRVAERLPHDVEAWIAKQSRDGRHFSHQGIEIRGFPSRFEIHLDGPSIELADDGARLHWQGHQAVLIMQSWNLKHMIIDVTGDNDLTLATSDGKLRKARLSAERAMASARMTERGELLVFAMDMEKVEVTGDTPVRAIGRTQLHIRNNQGESEDRPMGSLSVASLTEDARFVVEQPTFGDTADRLNFSLFLNSIPGNASPSALTRWRDGGGVLEVRGTEMQFGDIEIKGNATLAIDTENRVEGAGILNVYKAKSLVQALENRGVINTAVALGLTLAAPALEQDGNDQDPRPYVQVPFTLQDGKATISGFPIFDVPPLY